MRFTHKGIVYAVQVLDEENGEYWCETLEIEEDNAMHIDSFNIKKTEVENLSTTDKDKYIIQVAISRLNKDFNE